MLTKLVKQSVGISEIGKVEALSEPAIDGSKQIASTFNLSIITPETGQSCGSAQLPPASLLPACHHECSLELNFRFAGFSHHDHQFTPEPMQLGLVVSLTGLCLSPVFDSSVCETCFREVMRQRLWFGFYAIRKLLFERVRNSTVQFADAESERD